MILESGVFNNLKDYAYYCLHHKFDDLCSDYLLKLIELRNSNQTIFSLYSEEQIQNYCRIQLTEFLNNAIDGSFANQLQVSVPIKQINSVGNNVEIALLPEEIIWDLAARKNSLLNHISSYSNDLQVCLSITKALSQCNFILEERTIKSLQYQRNANAFSFENLSKDNIELELIDLIINNTEEGIFMFDKDLKILLWNSTLEKMNNIPREKALGKTIVELFPKYKNQPEELAFFEVLNGNKVHLRGNRFRNIDFFQAVIFPVIKNNEIAGGVAIINDTSKHQEFENRLLQKTIFIKEVQEILHLASWEWVVRNNQLQFSDEVYKIFGYGPEELESSVEFILRLLEEDTELIEAIFLHSLSNLSPFDFEARIRRKDGAIRYIQIKGKVLAYKNSVPYKIVGHCWDITERKSVEDALFKKNHELAEKNQELNAIHAKLKKMNDELEQRVDERTRQLYTINESLSIEISERKKMEQALKTKNSELQRINEDLDRFIYTASHDLKAPISNIEGLVSTLLYEVDDLKVENKQVIDLIKQSILKFKETINDLTDITKSNKNEPEELAYVDVRILLDEVKLSIKNLIQSSNACFKDSGITFPILKFSKVNLKSILFNLISNAIKYKHPDRNPEIEVECFLENEYVVLSIKDNGLGLNKEEAESVFTMFKRVHNHVEGTGIGLYLVKRIVDNNGGKITLQSDEGVGSKFRIYLKQS